MSGTVYKILDINDFSDSDYNDCLSLMTEQRRQAVDRLRFTNDKIRTVAGEHTAKKMIAERYGVPPEIIPFDRTDRGKPFAVGIPVEFSVSHSGAFVLCAVSDKPVGADIQEHHPVSDKLISRVCTARELAFVAEDGISQEEKLQRFFRVWTGKEAYSKYLGTGIRSLSDIDVFSHEIQRHMTYFQRGSYSVSIYSETEQPPAESR